MQVTASVRAVQVPDTNPMHPQFTTIYLVGRGQVLTIDSGEDMERYRWMLKGYLAASEKAEIGISAVTHFHADHSSNLRWLRDEFGSEVRDLPNLQLMCPGHGPVIQDPVRYIDAYIRGRHLREAQILAALAETPN